jgi:hypothetical protein
MNAPTIGVCGRREKKHAKQDAAQRAGSAESNPQPE